MILGCGDKHMYFNEVDKIVKGSAKLFHESDFDPPLDALESDYY